MNKIFGKPLGFLFAKEHKSSHEVPEFFDILCSFIATHGARIQGVFRVSGSVRQTEALKQQFEEAPGISYKAPMPNTDPNAIASLLKMYLRELPQPLIESRLYRKLCNLFDVSKNESSELSEIQLRERVIELRGLIRSMSERNVTVLERLMALCAYIVKLKDINMMTDENVSLVLGPNLMWPEKDEESEDEESPSSIAMNSLKDTPTICNIVSTLILNYSQIFENDSPYDSELLGTKNLPKDQLWVKKAQQPSSLVASRAGSIASVLNKNSPAIPTKKVGPTFPVPSQKTQGGTQGYGSSGSDVESKKNQTRNFRGHMPRGIVEKLSVGSDMIYPLRLVRLTGESLVLMTLRDATANTEARFLIDREIPFDHIKKLETMNQIKSATAKTDEDNDDEDSQPQAPSSSTLSPSGNSNSDAVNGVKVTYQQKGGFNTTVIITKDLKGTDHDPSLYHYVDTEMTLKEWHAHFSTVLKRYEVFVNLAKSDPDKFGAVLTKKEFKNAKQAKLQQQKKLEEERRVALDHPVDELLTSEGKVQNNIISINKLSYQQMINTITQMKEKLSNEEKTRKILEYRLQDIESQNKEYIQEVRNLKTKSIRMSDIHKGLTRKSARFISTPEKNNYIDEEDDYYDDDDYDMDSDDSIEFRSN